MHLRTTDNIGVTIHMHHHLGHEGINPPVKMRLLRHGSKPMRQAAAPEARSAYLPQSLSVMPGRMHAAPILHLWPAAAVCRLTHACRRLRAVVTCVSNVGS